MIKKVEGGREIEKNIYKKIKRKKTPLQPKLHIPYITYYINNN